MEITESKLESSVSDQEVNVNGYNILRSDRNRNGGGISCYVRVDVCFNSRIFSQIQLNILFSIYYCKPISISIFYRPANVNTFLENFFNDLKHTDLHKNEAYFLGDFNVNLLLNDKFLKRVNQLNLEL